MAYDKIKKEYDEFYTGLLKMGRLPMKSTDKGFWAVAVTDEIHQLFSKIDLNKYGSFLDLGSGDGKVALIASLFTKSSGIECDSELHNKAIEVMNKLNLNVTLHNGDYMEHDLSVYDAIFYNPDKVSPKLESKLKKELKGDLIVYGADFHPQNLSCIKTTMIDSTPVKIFRNE